jgi:Tfp pilus assembly protein PilX
MHRQTNRTSADPQAGGITIIVALMLLVLITVAAMGMSKNALRELAISGTSRQGSMARNVADSGIEWAVYWIDNTNSASATGTALGMKALKTTMVKAYPAMSGVAYDPNTQAPYNPAVLPTPPADTTISTAGGTKQAFTVAVTNMGQLHLRGIGQGITQGSFSPSSGGTTGGAAPLPDLWAFRSDSQVTVGTGPFASTFFHSKEAWVSTPQEK